MIPSNVAVTAVEQIPVCVQFVFHRARPQGLFDLALACQASKRMNRTIESISIECL